MMENVAWQIALDVNCLTEKWETDDGKWSLADRFRCQLLKWKMGT